jgi:hypothetical protein
MQRRAATRRRPQGVRLLQNSLSNVKHVRQPICWGVTHLARNPAEGSRRAADDPCEGREGCWETVDDRDSEPHGVPALSWAFATIGHRLLASALPPRQSGTDRGRQTASQRSPGVSWAITRQDHSPAADVGATNAATAANGPTRGHDRRLTPTGVGSKTARSTPTRVPSAHPHECGEHPGWSAPAYASPAHPTGVGNTQCW